MFRSHLLSILLAPLVALMLVLPAQARTAEAVFAGGCFWCMESELEGVAGVIDVVSGYTGGHIPNPTYQQVSSGRSGHVEAVRVRYDDTRISYEQLIDYFWSNIDPLDDQGQFCDKGSQYLSAVFVANAGERAVAEKTRDAAAKRLREPGIVKTQIRDAAPFYAAEAEHQDYYRKNPIRYRLYKQGCGRDQRLGEVWGDAPAKLK
jgi:peptide-methionine (S)-S-oxide reductase